MLASLFKIGHAPTDTARERRSKSIFTAAMMGFSLFVLQLAVFEERTKLELLLDCCGVGGILGALVVLHFGKRLDKAFVFLVSVELVVLTAVLFLNGNRYGDLFILLIIPLFAIVILGAQASRPWFAATVLVALVSGMGSAIFPDIASTLHRSPANPEGYIFLNPEREEITAKLLIGFLTSLTVIYLVIQSAYAALHQANDRIESLLLNMLPASIAARLTEKTRRKLQVDGTGIVDEYSDVTILFADIVGFTELASKIPPTELIAILDTVFTEFDQLADKYEVEKIKTVGDAYMAVCGLPEPNPNHAFRIADMALEMLNTIRNTPVLAETEVRLRIGINSGAVVAGVIGRKKFIYDLWGDAVNIASRMESHGLPDAIQVGAGAYNALKGAYDFEPLGRVEIKGKGKLPAWRLLAAK